ncbi:MAG: TIGR02996 domain-containing protein [Planctomycetes bacterium]|nr:TIGR02996 domain-containing protein [Planctomycetota bacterium]
MSEEDALLRSIIDRPEDDVVRLVFADWLDEHGDADRAEFIRGQCRLAAMQEWDDGFAELHARCGFLLRTHRDKWMPPVAKIREGAPDWMLRQYEFRRGFLDRLTMQPDHFADRWERLFELTPVRRVEIQPYPVDYFSDFWRCGGLCHLRRLWLHRSHYTPAQPTAAFSSAEWKTTDLGVPSDLAANLVEAITNAPYAPALERLEINARDPNGAVWSELCAASSLSNLKWFGFRSRLPLSAFIDLHRMSNPRWFSNLERLELVGTPARRQFVLPGVRPLLDAGPLRALILEGCGFNDREPSSLRTMPPVPLEHLDLGSGRGVGRKVLRALIRSPGLAALRSFALSGDGNAALTYLRDAPMRESLRVLRLSGCRASGMLSLAAAGCPQLARLDIGLVASGNGESRVLERVVGAVLNPAQFPRLISLRVRAEGPQPPDVFRRLIADPAVGRLRELGLFLRFGPDQLRLLAGVRALESLDRLQIPEHYLIADDSITPEKWVHTKEERKKAVAALQEHFGPRYDPSQ